MAGERRNCLYRRFWPIDCTAIGELAGTPVCFSQSGRPKSINLLSHKEHQLSATEIFAASVHCRQYGFHQYKLRPLWLEPDDTIAITDTTPC